MVDAKMVDCVFSADVPEPANVLNERKASDENVESCAPAGDDKYDNTLDVNCVSVDNIIARVMDDVVE